MGTVLRSSAILVVLAALGAQACTPRCQEVCTKVLDCGIESTRVSHDECILSCQLEENLFDVWEDKEKAAAFKAHKRCIRSSTCEEIAEGTCYDELLFVLEPQSQP
ncbi:MAG: hypothetical protein H6734_11550 [Alphaproteobacteria bacterium]|nr:hypothetical protein [Alphaproteobacteria bacterium]